MGAHRVWIFIGVLAAAGVLGFGVLAVVWGLTYDPVKPLKPPPTPHFAVRYSVSDLGLAPSQRVTINNRGDVAGAMVTALSVKSCCGRYPIIHAALWRDGHVTDLGSVGHGNSEATGLNDRGRVVGVYDTNRVGRDKNMITRGFLWKDGRMADLNTLGTATCSPEAINGAGQVVGEAEIPPLPQDKGTGPVVTHAFLWNRGRVTDLTWEAGGIGTDSRAVDISDAGETVGEVDGAPVVWKDGRVTRLGDGDLAAVSRSGHIAADTFLRAGGKETYFGRPVGYPAHASPEGWTSANAVNESDEVVGTVTWSAGRAAAEGGYGWEKSVAFVWRNGHTYDLNSLIPADSGWQLEDGQSVSDSGWIVGFGTHNGKKSAFLLRPR